MNYSEVTSCDDNWTGHKHSDTFMCSSWACGSILKIFKSTKLKKNLNMQVSLNKQTSLFGRHEFRGMERERSIYLAGYFLRPACTTRTLFLVFIVCNVLWSKTFCFNPLIIIRSISTKTKPEVEWAHWLNFITCFLARFTTRGFEQL